MEKKAKEEMKSWVSRQPAFSYCPGDPAKICFYCWFSLPMRKKKNGHSIHTVGFLYAIIILKPSHNNNNNNNNNLLSISYASGTMLGSLPKVCSILSTSLQARVCTHTLQIKKWTLRESMWLAQYHSGSRMVGSEPISGHQSLSSSY